MSLVPSRVSLGIERQYPPQFARGVGSACDLVIGVTGASGILEKEKRQRPNNLGREALPQEEITSTFSSLVAVEDLCELRSHASKRIEKAD